jgi:hypothetical protein
MKNEKGKRKKMRNLEGGKIQAMPISDRVSKHLSKMPRMVNFAPTKVSTINPFLRCL